MIEYKATIYNENWWFKANIKDLIENVLDFSESINTWQWELVIKIRESFNSTRFAKWDLVAISLYSDNFKNWLPRYSWILRWVRRVMNNTWQFLELKFYWIFDFLNDIEVSKTYSWPLNEVIDEILTDAWTNNDISEAKSFLGAKKLKNLVSDTTSVNYEASEEDLLQVLISIFESIEKKFFINMKWEIIEESSEVILIPAWRKWVQIEIDEDWETDIIVNNFEYLKNYSVNSPIKILNIEKDFNLNWEVIQEISFNDFETTLRLWQVLRFWLK